MPWDCTSVLRSVGKTYLPLTENVDKDTSICTPEQFEAMELAVKARKASCAKAEAQQYHKVSMSCIQVHNQEAEAYNEEHHASDKQEFVPIM